MDPSENIQVPRDENYFEVSETDAVKSCIRKTAKFFIVSQTTLETRDLRTLLSVIGEKKLLLYFHNERDEFSEAFCKSLGQTAMKTVLKKFCILGWDVSDAKYHKVLVNVLIDHNLNVLKSLVESEVSAAICLQRVDGSVTVVSCLTGEMSGDEILKELEEAEKKIVESASEMDAVKSCITKTAPFRSGMDLETKELKQLHSESFTSRKPVILFLYNELDELPKIFCESLADVLKRFYVLGWDVGESKYHDILLNTLSSYNLHDFVDFVKEKISTIIFLRSVDETFMPIGSLNGHADIFDITKKLKCVLSEIDKAEKAESYHFKTNVKKFEKKELKEILAECLFAPFDHQGKKVLLCLHNKGDDFAKILKRYIESKTIIIKIMDKFCLLGCDVDNTDDHKAILRTLNSNKLESLNSLVKNKDSALIRLRNVNGRIEPLHIIKGTLSDSQILRKLTYEDNDITSERYQKLMADMLGDRDYDLIDFNQKVVLPEKVLEMFKKCGREIPTVLEWKVGFALYGPPQDEKTCDYDSKQIKRIKKLCEIIITESNQVAQYLDQIEISFIYNCVEPLDEEILKKAKKYEDYNPNTDLMPIPLFILRKCRRVSNPISNPCRIFIDDTGRVYSTWQDYKENNKLHECIMVLPLDGRYDVGKDENVRLERISSPACSLAQQALRGADIANMGVGLASGGVFIAAGVASVTVLPAVLITAGVAGAVAGVYSITRSAISLHDRSEHKQSINFFESSEARGAYLNIVAGALGFAGTGANMVVAQLASRGANLGKGAIYAVNTINVINLGVSGANVVNSFGDVLYQWICEDQQPSLLTLVQLGSSVLFFGNAVYNFKSAGNIIEESQARTMKEYQDSLRSNRHRKMFDKMTKETIRQNDGNVKAGRAEVIKTVRNIPNKDDVFASLTRHNKQMNKDGVKFSASNGQIQLNGQNIDMGTFISMSKNEANMFLGKLPMKTVVTPTDIKSMKQVYTIYNLTDNLPTADWNNIINYSVKLIGVFHGDVQSKIISTLSLLLAKILPDIKKILKDLFPDAYSKYISLLEVVVQFFNQKARELDEQFEKWRTTKNSEFYNPLFIFINTNDTEGKHKNLFENIVRACFDKGKMKEEALKNLLAYVHAWIASKAYEKQNDEEKEKMIKEHSKNFHTKLVKCHVCKGKFYSNIK